VNDLERSVRATLHAIADDAGSPSGLSAAERAIDRHRRERRRRARLWGTAAATLVVAAAIPLALGTWTPVRNGAQAAASLTVDADAGGAPSITPSTSARETAAAAGADTGEVETGPADPETGVAYSFDLYTHCGIRWTTFGGRDWRAVQPAPEPKALPGPDGVSTVDFYTGGTMTLVDEDLLRFTITEPDVEGRGETFDFVPMTETDPRPLCD
jgi:hypothetical protein